MEHLDQLSRHRMRIMYNLLPAEIGSKSAPSFLVRVPYYTYDKEKYSITALPEVNLEELHLNMKKQALRRTSVAVSMLGKGAHKKQLEETVPMMAQTRKGNPIKFVPFSVTKSGLYDAGCLTCGKENIVVKFHGERHVCVKCRQYLRNDKNDPVAVFLNEQGEIEAWAHKNIDGVNKYYKANPEKMKIFEWQCYATFSGENELVVLLQDEQKSKQFRSHSFTTKAKRKISIHH
eukprot:TRINITY_DN8815_c0_g1_i1.p1 TRINITY_DN8815_c0_g1~~TRINITY_DN8815_c0_g1_i1.p1  ORF type:complete len:233 (+),score=40.76 TRINITY_DN8815_c0_g1_i1:30-728(+)